VSHLAPRVAAATLLLSAIGCSGQPAAPTPTVIVLKRSVEHGNVCWQATPEDAPPSDLPLCAAPFAGNVISGVDHLSLVVEYAAAAGPLRFVAGQTPPAPTVTMLLDGVATPIAGTPRASASLDPFYYDVDFVAPAPATSMVFEVQAEAGYGAPPTAPITVVPRAFERFSASCPRLVDPAGGSAFGGNRCVAGTGSASLTAEIASSTADTVTVVSAVDGVPLGSVALTTSAGVDDTGTSIAETTLAPVPVPSADEGDASWTLTGTFGATTSPPATLALVAPRPLLSILGPCASTTCSGGTGQVNVTVELPGATQQIVQLTSTVGAVTSTQQVTVGPMNPLVGPLSGSMLLNVPIASSGALWTLTASYQDQLASKQFTIVSPMPTLSVTCGSTTPCAPREGGVVALTIGAPGALQDPTAVVRTSVNGVPDQQLDPLTLTSADGGATLTSTSTLQVPMSPGAQWTISAVVGGYATPSQALTIVP
jgi:hypothetical protein